MAHVSKVLTAVDDELIMPVPADKLSVTGIQLPTGSVGTYVLEGSLDRNTWVTIQMRDPAGGASFSSLAVAGAVGFADTSYLESVKVRKTVGVVAETIHMVVRTNR